MQRRGRSPQAGRGPADVVTWRKEFDDCPGHRAHLGCVRGARRGRGAAQGSLLARNSC